LIGIGCDDHGDQVAGLLVARRVAAAAPAAVTVFESCGSPHELIAAWADAGDVTIVEAMPGAVPGDIGRCQPHPRPLAFGCSPTRLSPELREAMASGPLPEQITVITIAAQRFSRSAGVSPEVAEAAHRVAAEILDGLGAVPNPHLTTVIDEAPPARLPAGV
jgi:hydrogenase maturation protease